MRNLVSGFFKGIWAILLRIIAAVTHAPGNWIAVLVGVATIAVTIVVTAPSNSPSPSETESMPSGSNESGGSAPLIIAPAPTEEQGSNESGGLVPPIIAPTEAQENGSAGGTPATGQCDAEYRLAMQEQLRRLIEAEIGRCATWTRDQIELHYSCSLREDVYRIRLVRQYSGGLNGEVLRFEAEYDGPREFDVSRLRIRPLTSDYRRLCAEARRRRGY